MIISESPKIKQTTYYLPDEKEIKKNKIIKDLGLLLPQLDNRISWIDYLPKRKLKTNQDIIILGMCSGKVKYIDVTGESDFDLVNRVLNTLNDWNLAYQFLTSKQASLIENDVYNAANETYYLKNQILQALSNYEITDDECEDFVLNAQKHSIFPDFFIPNLSHKINVNTLSDFLKTNKSTFIDTEMLMFFFQKELIKHKQLEKLEENFEIEASQEEDFLNIEYELA